MSASPTSRLPAAEGTANAVTTWLPLTTVYPIVPHCTEAFYSPDNFTHLYAWDPNQNAATFETHCWPDVVTSWWNQETSAASTTSLGPFLCPQAYTVAVTSTVGTASTLTGCCPIGYGFSSLMSQALPGGCTSVLTSGQTVTYAAPESANTDSYFTTSTVVTADHVIQAVQVNGYNFVGNSAVPTYTGFSSVSDSSSSSSSNSNSKSTASQTSSTIQSPASESSSASQSSTSSSTGITTATKVGIAIGVSLGIIVVGGVIGLILFRMRRKRPYQKTPPSELDTGVSTPSFKPENTPFAPQRPARPDVAMAHEMHGSPGPETNEQQIAEMTGYHMAEMDGNAKPVDKGAYRRY
ncbi:LPXTG-motif cell wall anchor protein [Rutstroemia sp. NJR-2017a BBW]|nr:LPXTG-motif cell wall anchor protein [Rutstroemia sp. NJR-2017a BBW]